MMYKYVPSIPKLHGQIIHSRLQSFKKTTLCGMFEKKLNSSYTTPNISKINLMDITQLDVGKRKWQSIFD